MNEAAIEVTKPSAKAVGLVVYLNDANHPAPPLEAFAAVGLIVVQPHFGPCWVDRGDGTALMRLRTELLPQLRTDHKLPIAIAGVGMGGAGALTLGFRLRGEVSVVVADRAAVDFYEAYGEGTELDEHYPSREACRQDGPILAIDPFRHPSAVRFHCPTEHPNHRGNDRLHEKLAALGIEHTWNESTPQADELARWIVAELTKVKRKLI